MVLLIDNYDSFVYNLARYVGRLGFKRTVVRHDAITLERIKALAPSHIIISPGPCTPNKAGISLAIVKAFLQHSMPILGICLGHQVIGQALGAKIIRAKRPLHGMGTPITHTNTGILKGLGNPLQVGRYHSLVIEKPSIPDCLEITAWTEDGEIMAVRHKDYDIQGVQFHPESIVTNHGHALLRNFLKP